MTSTEPSLFGASDIGKTRNENQDHFVIARLRRQLDILQTDVPNEDRHQLYGGDLGHLLIVADGMGGHRDGAMASRRAVKACSCYVLDVMEWFLKLSPQNEDDFIDELKLAIHSAQKSIWGGECPGGRDSGTTVTMAYVLGSRMYVVHAGDSRCYLLRGGNLEQLTTDHTYAQKLVDQGALSAAEAATSRWRHVLYNCVGGSDERVTAEVSRVNLQDGDQVLLCTDGLSGVLNDQQILEILDRSSSPQESVKSLIAAANQAGGDDNITAIVATDLFYDAGNLQECGCDTLRVEQSLDDTVDLQD